MVEDEFVRLTLTTELRGTREQGTVFCCYAKSELRDFEKTRPVGFLCSTINRNGLLEESAVSYV